MIKTIIFDFGSVLFKEDWKSLSKEMEKKFGISTLIRSDYGKAANETWNNANIGKSRMSSVFREICHEKNINLNIKKVCEYYIAAYNKSKVLNKELIKRIKSLKKKYCLACHTDTNELHYEGHKRQKLLNLFHKHFASHLIGKRKFDKKAFKIVIKKLRIKPEETLFVDDNKLNISNARSLGMKTIQFKNNKDFSKRLGGFLK